MKVAVFIYSMTAGGAERVTSYLLSYLVNQGVEVHLILMNDTFKYEVPSNLNIHYIENSNPLEAGILKWVKLPMLAWRYARLLKKLEITHSFSLLTRPNYINILSRFFTSHKFKLIISERNYPSLQYGYNNLQSKINHSMVRSLYRKADLIISNAKASAADLAENFNCLDSRIKVIYNPIDIEKIDQITSNADPFDPNVFNIVSVGRLDVVKNHQLAIRAVKDLKNVHLHIVGFGGLENELKKLIEDLDLTDRVFLMGFQSNPFQYIKAADLFVLSSNHEGFPNVLLEAMACGCPVISTNCKSGPDELLEVEDPDINGILKTKYGIMVPTNNMDLMRQGIEYFIENPDYHNSCGKNARQRAENFSKEIILKKYLQTIANA